MDNPTLEKLICDPSFLDYCLNHESDNFTYWENWIQENPQYGSLVVESKTLVLQLQAMPSEEEVATERQRLYQAIDEVKVYRQFLFGKWFPYAAACLLVVGMCIFLFRQRPAILQNPIPIVALLKQQVSAGKYMNVQLTDGTKVRLGPTSSLDYPQQFAASERKVTLKGEAFFDVAHRTEQPFIIHTGEFHVKVLGTSFNIHAFEEDKVAKIALFTGKVEIFNDSIRLVILPGQAFVYDKVLAKYTIESFDQGQERETMNGLLHFNHATYSDIGKQLARKYGISFQSNAAIDLDFSGTIEHESLDQVLDKLTLTTSYRFSLESNTLIAHKK
ncbi:fec operon regulator FecR [compost metagenome]